MSDRSGAAVAQGAASYLIEAHGLDKVFYDGDREITVLKGLEFAARAGEEIAIVGQSGVGKSTLLYILGSMERPSAGTVLFEGRDVFALDEAAIADFRNHRLGFVFQFHYLLGDFTAVENVMMPALIARLPDREARQKAEQVLSMVGLADKLHRRPAELSGGEQQRVAVARAVVLGPRIVLADEPTGNLDPHTADEVHELFHRLNRELGLTLIVATHNERLTRAMGRALRLREGKLFEEPRG